MIKRLLLGLLFLLVLLAAVLAVNTLRKGSRQIDVAPIAELVVDKQAAASHLSEAVQARTISSRTDAAQNADQFARLQSMLQARYPKAHAVLKREVVNDLSLLYMWQGSDPKAKPIMLMAHQDVVPISPGTEDKWTAEPFAGTIRDGFVWGRGAWDDKGNLIAQMEAIEMLAASGYRPERTIYLAFGADEEVGGDRGAVKIAALLQQRGVRLDFVIDEGLLITEGILPGLTPPAAIIGVAEKGSVSMQLAVDAPAGHSSMPPPAAGTGAIAMLATALKAIDEDPMPAAISGVSAEMFATIAPEMNGLMRVAMSNLWLFGPVVQRLLEAGASTNALLRTTTALTVLRAGDAENVLPGQAWAIINYRTLPGNDSVGIMKHLQGQVARILSPGQFQLQIMPGAFEASGVTPTQSNAYQLINRTVREVFPGTVVTPGLMVGGTDSRHFSGISDQIFKFSPVRAKSEDLARFHGTNERISLDNLAELIRFYHRLLTMGAKATRTPLN
jgi:carboxypeptidase PM20D1